MSECLVSFKETQNSEFQNSEFQSSEFPAVSIIIPVRNEEEYICACLSNIDDQTYPNIVEVICVDGLSNDSSRTLIEGYQSKNFQVRLLDNPKGIVPVAMNTGIRFSVGEIIVRIDSRTFIEPDYVANAVSLLQTMGAAGVGGPQVSDGINYVSKVIAIAMNSRFGMGAAHRFPKDGMYVDTVYLGVYKKDTIEQVGYFDERFVRNQDYEFNYRVSQQVGPLYCSPKIKSTYIGRSSLAKLSRQFNQYGYWKTRTIRKHPRSLKVRQMVAPLLVTTLAVSGFLSLFIAKLFLVTSAIFLLYAAASIYFSFKQLGQYDSRYVVALPLVYGIIHFSWGIGFIHGLIELVFSNKLRTEFQPTEALGIST